MYYYRYSCSASSKRYRENMIEETQALYKSYLRYFEGKENYLKYFKITKFVYSIYNETLKDKFSYKDIIKIEENFLRI